MKGYLFLLILIFMGFNVVAQSDSTSISLEDLIKKVTRNDDKVINQDTSKNNEKDIIIENNSSYLDSLIYESLSSALFLGYANDKAAHSIRRKELDLDIFMGVAIDDRIYVADHSFIKKNKEYIFENYNDASISVISELSPVSKGYYNTKLNCSTKFNVFKNKFNAKSGYTIIAYFMDDEHTSIGFTTVEFLDRLKESEFKEGGLLFDLKSNNNASLTFQLVGNIKKGGKVVYNKE